MKRGLPECEGLCVSPGEWVNGEWVNGEWVNGEWVKGGGQERIAGYNAQ
jgi:hypothetical protein